jgi:hypothetical protein
MQSAGSAVRLLPTLTGCLSVCGIHKSRTVALRSAHAVTLTEHTAVQHTRQMDSKLDEASPRRCDRGTEEVRWSLQHVDCARTRQVPTTWKTVRLAYQHHAPQVSVQQPQVRSDRSQQPQPSTQPYLILPCVQRPLSQPSDITRRRQPSSCRTSYYPRRVAVRSQRRHVEASPRSNPSSTRVPRLEAWLCQVPHHRSDPREPGSH